MNANERSANYSGHVNISARATIIAALLSPSVFQSERELLVTRRANSTPTVTRNACRAEGEFELTRTRESAHSKPRNSLACRPLTLAQSCALLRTLRCSRTRSTPTWTASRGNPDSPHSRDSRVRRASDRAKSRLVGGLARSALKGRYPRAGYRRRMTESREVPAPRRAALRQSSARGGTRGRAAGRFETANAGCVCSEYCCEYSTARDERAPFQGID